MSPKSKRKISEKAKSKNERLAKNNPSLTKTIAELKKSRKSKPSKTKRLKNIKNVPQKRLKIENDFIQIAHNHPELQDLKKIVQYLGLSFEGFLDAINIRRFLETNDNPKGAINEVLILQDKLMIAILKDRADASVKNLILSESTLEIQKAGTNNWIKKNDFKIDDVIGNVKNKKINLKDFESIQTVLAKKFNTLPNNKDYLDFAMIRYNAETNSLFLIIPGEVKEPKAAAELAEQFGRFVRRLKESDKVGFQLGNEIKSVPAENVFFVKDNSVGVARRKDNFADPRNGKNISDQNPESPIMSIINANFKDSKPEKNIAKNKQEFIRLIIRIHPEISPQRIQDALIEIKTKILKIPHK